MRCKRCGRTITQNQFVSIADGGAICNSCMCNKSYYTQNNTNVRKTTLNGKTYGFELECVPYSQNDKAKMLLPKYNLIPTHDGSLPTGGVEFKTPIYNNLKNMRNLFATFCKYVDFSDNRCGQHINIGHPTYFNIYSMNVLRRYSNCIFDELYYQMQNNLNKPFVRDICGRYFVPYARHESSYTTHTSWINLAHDNRIEFRLSKFNSPNQYFELINMWGDMVDCIINNFIIPTNCYSPNRRRISIAKATTCANKTSKKLIKIFYKYKNKGARCQRYSA